MKLVFFFVMKIIDQENRYFDVKLAGWLASDHNEFVVCLFVCVCELKNRKNEAKSMQLSYFYIWNRNENSFFLK